MNELLYRDKETICLINKTVANADVYVRKGYLSVLNRAEILPLNSSEMEINPGTNMRMLKIDSFVFEDEQSISQKLRNIYAALEKEGLTALLLLEGKTEKVNIYMGICAKKAQEASRGFYTFLNSFDGIFPGSRYHNVKDNAVSNILEKVLPAEEKISIAAISGMPEDVSANKEVPMEKLDVLIDGMRGKPFSMILLAQYIEKGELSMMRQGLESLYTQISPFQKQDVTMSKNESENYGINLSESITRSLSISTGVSYGETKTTGSGRGMQEGPNNREKERYAAAIQAGGAAIALGANLLIPGSGESVNILQSLFYAQGVSNFLMNLGEASGVAPEANRKSETINDHEENSINNTKQETIVKGDNKGKTEGVNAGMTFTYGKTMQRSQINKSVSNLLEEIEKQIRQISSLEQQGAFRTAAYFIAGDKETASSAANLYRSLVSSGRNKEISPIYQWSEREDILRIRNYLIRGSHPVFSFGEQFIFSEILAAQPVGIYDMPVYFCLPEKSVPGLEVANHATFSRDILTRTSGANKTEERMVEIGCIYHMGKEETSTRVQFCVDELTKHLFVSGATGVGKSNFCYQLMDQLLKYDVKMLVVEPAKGEYARIFGGRDGFHVYGTNIRYAPILRINPFAFPDGVHVVEHIDRLLTIFNATWPMYSAMPAILKDAIHEIYIDKGFDMYYGDKPQDGEFPEFNDLLEKLPEVITRSAYSGEVKGNYIGALVTRVKSLTDGIYGAVFDSDEIGDEHLFDENVIVDLSRVGSAETKSLLMGVLVMRLNEYRMCSGVMNSKLKHVTLLEEAHHLLRRQTISSVEGANMQTTSLEMITNAIAEMRTYGEGFVIADQSPSVMDQSVIRNTQTKVYFMLSDSDDQKIAGNSISLNNRQMEELSKLHTGVMVAYQNQWSEPVLCKVDYYDSRKNCPYVHTRIDYVKRTKECITQALALLLKDRLHEKDPSSVNKTCISKNMLNLEGLPYQTVKMVKPIFQCYLDGKAFPTELNKLAIKLEKLSGLEIIFQKNMKCEQIDIWAKNMASSVRRVADLNDQEIQSLILIGIQARIRLNPEFKKLYVRYLVYCKESADI